MFRVSVHPIAYPIFMVRIGRRHLVRQLVCISNLLVFTQISLPELFGISNLSLITHIRFKFALFI